jgi:hypothetical protein
MRQVNRSNANKKLRLHKEWIRTLSEHSLRDVNGGYPPATAAAGICETASCNDCDELTPFNPGQYF